jgi:hypothetical protein
MNFDRDEVEDEGRLPFTTLLPFAVGIAVGMLLRFVFSDESEGPFSAMSGAFVFGAPLIVGAITTLVAERIKPRRWVYYASAGAFAVAMFIAGTMIIMIEGLICAALVSPLFAALGAIGGLIMGAACRLGRRTGLFLRCVPLLPLALLGVEDDTNAPTQIYEIEHDVVIAAPSDVVWRHIQDIRNIRTDEVGAAWAFRIGVPLPESGVSVHAGTSPVRRVTMGKHVYFDQVVAESRANEYVRWTYKFYEDSFPPGAFDDHVRIGGRYFDLVDTSYTLVPEPAGTRLVLKFRYRLSTRFNWYAGPVLHVVMSNAADTYLSLYAARARAQDART